MTLLICDMYMFGKRFVLLTQERRRQIFRTTKASIAKYMDDLEQSPNTSFERDVFSDECDSFLLNNGKLKSLKDWHDGVCSNITCSCFEIVVLCITESLGVIKKPYVLNV